MSGSGADWLPDAHWGTAETPLPDWRQAPDDADPDDEELPETPPDVIAMLGFDPRAEAGMAGDAEWQESKHDRDANGQFTASYHAGKQAEAEHQADHHPTAAGRREGMAAARYHREERIRLEAAAQWMREHRADAENAIKTHGTNINPTKLAPGSKASTGRYIEIKPDKPAPVGPLVDDPDEPPPAPPKMATPPKPPAAPPPADDPEDEEAAQGRGRQRDPAVQPQMRANPRPGQMKIQAIGESSTLSPAEKIKQLEGLVGVSASRASAILISQWLAHLAHLQGTKGAKSTPPAEPPRAEPPRAEPPSPPSTAARSMHHFMFAQPGVYSRQQQVSVEADSPKAALKAARAQLPIGGGYIVRTHEEHTPAGKKITHR